MQYTLRIISQSEEINDAVRSIGSYGYFRELSQEEIKSSAFVEIGGKAGFMWFQWISHEFISGHIIIHPGHRRRAITRHIIDGGKWMAELMGATRLYALDPPEVIIRYLKRLKWESDKYGMFIPLR